MFLKPRQVFSRLCAGLKTVTDSPKQKIQGLMHGKHPVTQTKQYLEQGIILRDCVKIMTIHYGDYEQNYQSHDGVRKIVELNFSQLQYKNPNVQILVLKDLTPTPFFTFFLDNGERFHIDVESMSQIEILHQIQKVIGKPRELIAQETKAIEDNPANFGENFKRKCICHIEGQVPCSSSDKLVSYDKDVRKTFGFKYRPLNVKKHPYGEEDEFD